MNAGAATLIAAGHLLRALSGCQGKRVVRLFEGFVSFKPQENERKSEQENECKSKKEERIEEHKKDVLALKNAVWDRTNANIFDPTELRKDPTHRIESAFSFLDKRLIPPVIRIDLSP